VESMLAWLLAAAVLSAPRAGRSNRKAVAGRMMQAGPPEIRC